MCVGVCVCENDWQVIAKYTNFCIIYFFDQQ